MHHCTSVSNSPLGPDDLQRLDRIYAVVRFNLGCSRYNPLSERIAAMAIRFYQLGIHNDEHLVALILQACSELSDNVHAEAAR